MLANSVSPPNGGTSRAISIVAIGGRSRYAVSECHNPPKFIFSCSSLITGVISGNPSMPLMKGYSIACPKHFATPRNRSGGSVWSRKKITQCLSHAARIAAMLSSPSSCPRSMPRISAPSAPATGRISSAFEAMSGEHDRQLARTAHRALRPGPRGAGDRRPLDGLARHGHGRIGPQELLDRGRDQLGLGHEPAAILGKAREMP